MCMHALAFKRTRNVSHLTPLEVLEVSFGILPQPSSTLTVESIAKLIDVMMLAHLDVGFWTGWTESN